ncbi:MAG: hypothetical protein HY470_00180 [Candidatus Ryanbacteria bacterium]|nr:hypothetical protein [Candidatus Ryanbacteria bacterium]
MAVPLDFAVRFFEGGVGDIGEGDVKAMAAAKIAFIVGFRVKTQASAVELASRAGATVRTFEVIHEAADWMKEEFAKYVPKKIVREELGKLLVLKIFGASQAGRILGGRMKSGRAEKGAHFDVLRAGEKVFSGTAVGLQRNKIAVDELREGEEGGLLVHVPKAVEERDTLLFYRELEA